MTSQTDQECRQPVCSAILWSGAIWQEGVQRTQPSELPMQRLPPYCRRAAALGPLADPADAPTALQWAATRLWQHTGAPAAPLHLATSACAYVCVWLISRSCSVVIDSSSSSSSAVHAAVVEPCGASKFADAVPGEPEAMRGIRQEMASVLQVTLRLTSCAVHGPAAISLLGLQDSSRRMPCAPQYLQPASAPSVTASKAQLLSQAPPRFPGRLSQR